MIARLKLVALLFMFSIMSLLCTESMLAQAQDGQNWRVDINRQVFKNLSWSWVLRYIEKEGDSLIVGIAYKNNASSARPIYLDEAFQESTQLTDNETSQAYPVMAVSGISAESTQVGRRKRKEARFTFPYPAGSTQLSFSSVWITGWMMNAASRMQVEFPLILPDREHN